MKIFDGQDTLIFERKEEQLIVFLTGTQVKPQELNFIKSKIALGEALDKEFAFQVVYPLLDNLKNLKDLVMVTKSQLQRLELALKLKYLIAQRSGYKIPFVHPENIFFINGDFSFIHVGMREALVPMETDASFFLSQYKALVLSVLNPKISYENLVNGEKSLKDKLSQAIASSHSLEEVHHLVEIELIKEKQKDESTLVKVPRARYNFFKYAGSAALVATIAIGTLTFIDRTRIIPKQQAVTKAQTNFITKHYDKTLDDLKDYQPNQLSKDARFVLASSSIHLADLSQTQKSAILNNISSTTDDNTLNYWIYQGRGEFEKSLNLAKNIGDDQLTLLAYTDLYQATKLNSVMDGNEKQKKLEEYNKQIQELSKNLG